MKRAVIVASARSYRTPDFLKAASLLRMDIVVATDGLPPVTTEGQIQIDLSDPKAAGRVIAALDPKPEAVVAVDDQGVLVAAEAAAALGLAHNDPQAVSATRDKLKMRELLDIAAVPQPTYRAAGPGEVAASSAEIGYPVVIKPRGLSASRGVIRADDGTSAGLAENRIRKILDRAGRYPEARLLVEEFVPGEEVAVEGLLIDGELEVLAVIDKPDPLDGPFFEETLYITPSRHAPPIQQAVVDIAEKAAGALGLRSGPIHAEIRIVEGRGPVLIEVAARSIGGLCGRAFSFGLPHESLEVLILRSALGLPTIDTTPSKPATGVLMLPIPAIGILTGVDGIDEALALKGIDGVDITIPKGRRVEALPEGDRYLGFVFASGADPAAVEHTLRTAGNILSVSIDGEEIRAPVAASSPSDETTSTG